MIKLEFPEIGTKVKEEGSKKFIWDSLRKKWLALTPEEWVRQNIVAYLIHVLSYPSTLVALEKEIEVAGMKKRFDILVYDVNHKPWMLIECKAPEVKLNEEVLNQVLRYHLSIPVPYLVISNGDHCYGWKKENAGLKELSELPPFGTDKI